LWLLCQTTLLWAGNVKLLSELVDWGIGGLQDKGKMECSATT
jgi:hypothetical protein